MGGFIDDVDGVHNRSGTIPGYGEKGSDEPIVFKFIKKLISELIMLIKSLIPAVG